MEIVPMRNTVTRTKKSYQRETKDRKSDESLEVKKTIKYHIEPEAQTHKEEKGSKRGEI